MKKKIYIYNIKIKNIYNKKRKLFKNKVEKVLFQAFFFLWNLINIPFRLGEMAEWTKALDC